MNNIYILKAYTPDFVIDSDREEKYVIENNDIKLLSENIGVFDSVEKSEETMKNIIKYLNQKRDKYSFLTDYCAFILTEHELNAGIDEYCNPSGYESVRSYLGNGELNCFSDYDDRCTKPFVGRDDVSKYVKEGDYAFYLRGKVLSPILIETLSPTKEEWKKHFKEDVVGDISDDSGISYMTDYGHCHPFSPYIFPLSILPKYIISEDLKNKLKFEMEKDLENNS